MRIKEYHFSRTSNCILYYQLNKKTEAILGRDETLIINAKYNLSSNNIPDNLPIIYS